MISLSKILVISFLLAMVVCKSQYKVVTQTKTISSVALNIQYTGSDDFYVKQKSPIVKQLKIVFKTHTYNDFHFKITDATKPRFEVPQSGVFPIDPLTNFSFPMASADVVFEYTSQPFDFKIKRRQNGAVLFSTYDKEMIYSDHYLQIGTEVDSKFIYGIGERFTDGFRKKDGKWTIFNRDRAQRMDKGQGLQTYGFYPFYLMKEKSLNLFHINYFRNSNAMDVIKEQVDGKHYITYKVIGGVLDFRFFLGQNKAENTVQKLQFYAGRAHIPPFWSFGFHQCRYGYKNITYLHNVLEGYEKNGIPLDTIWTDIDYMQDYEDFTIDDSRFPIDQMKKILENYRWIPIIDAGIKNSGQAFEEGAKRNTFIKQADRKTDYIGKVWPGSTTFVDFFHPNGSQYWQDMLNRLYTKLEFSGVWLDMNEVANFCNGPCTTPTVQSKFDYTNDLPYHPGSDNIQTQSISLNTTHYGGLEESNVHAFFGFLQTHATFQFLRRKGRSPFIISRSSTLGSAKFGFHWTGDNTATYEYLKGSIADNFNSMMTGINMVGPDVCGFGGNTTEELCSRWYQLAALYPFARNHNDIWSIDQEPFALGNKVLKASLNNMKFRYSFLKQLYTHFVSKKGLGMIWKPVFFDYPNDQNLYIDEIADTHFLVGSDLLAAPILQPLQTTRNVYFPSVNWYDLQSGKLYKAGTNSISNEMTEIVPLFMKQGSVVLLQNVDNVRQTHQLDNKFKLVTGMKYDSQRSTETEKVYEARGSILSLSDYNNETKVDFCSFEGCEYSMSLILTEKNNVVDLELDVIYLGGSTLNQKITINEITVYYGEQVINSVLKNSIQVTQAMKVVIPLKQNQLTIRQE